MTVCRENTVFNQKHEASTLKQIFCFLDLEMAVAYWNLVLTGRFKFLDLWNRFLLVSVGCSVVSPFFSFLDQWDIWVSDMHESISLAFQACFVHLVDLYKINNPIPHIDF